MRLTIKLTTEESIALRRFHAANQPPTMEEAAALALPEFLIGTGDLGIGAASSTGETPKHGRRAGSNMHRAIPDSGYALHWSGPLQRYRN